MQVWQWVYTCHNPHMDVRIRLCGLDSLLLDQPVGPSHMGLTLAPDGLAVSPGSTSSSKSPSSSRQGPMRSYESLMCLSAQWPEVLFCFNKLVCSTHQYQMNKLVISCPPGAVSLMDSRLEGHFLLFIITGSSIIYFFPYDNFEFAQLCRVLKGWWAFSSQEAAMALSSPPQRNG